MESIERSEARGQPPAIREIKQLPKDTNMKGMGAATHALSSIALLSFLPESEIAFIPEELREITEIKVKNNQ